MRDSLTILSIEPGSNECLLPTMLEEEKKGTRKTERVNPTTSDIWLVALPCLRNLMPDPGY